MFYAVLVMALMIFCPSGLLGFADRLLTRTTRAEASDATPGPEAAR